MCFLSLLPKSGQNDDEFDFVSWLFGTTLVSKSILCSYTLS